MTATNALQAAGSSSTLSRSSSSNAYKGDRFIPFRGTTDNFYMEEYMLTHEDPFKEQKKKRQSQLAINGRRSQPNPPSAGVESHQTGNNSNGSGSNISMTVVDEMYDETDSRLHGIHSTPNGMDNIDG